MGNKHKSVAVFATFEKEDGMFQLTGSTWVPVTGNFTTPRWESPCIGENIPNSAHKDLNQISGGTDAIFAITEESALSTTAEERKFFMFKVNGNDQFLQSLIKLPIGCAIPWPKDILSTSGYFVTEDGRLIENQENGISIAC